jgi:histidinol-phosphate aminotransferase
MDSAPLHMSDASLKDRLQPHILDIQPYPPGKPISELQRELGVSHVIKLASNENPLGCSPRATAAIQNNLKEVARYPDGNAYYLKKALSEFTGRSEEEVLIGNGSNEVLELIARTFCGPGDEIIYSQYAFAVYAISAQVVGATGVEVPAKDYGHDLAAMANAVTPKTKVIYLANPNNPTGTLFNREAWERFIQSVPENVIVVLDEAYLEYVEDSDYPNGLDYLDQYPNLVLTRTFSKAYGLASLRVGYLLASKEIVSYINRLRMPFNVNHFALAAAEAALQDRVFVEKGVLVNQQGMEALTEFLNEAGVRYIPSSANFITIEVGPQALEIYQKLLENGIIVRPLGNYHLPNHLRVSIGTPSEMRKFIMAFREVMTGLGVLDVA